MDTKGPINPPSHNKSYIHVIIDAFSHFVVTVPIKSNNAKTAIKTLLHHWIIKFGPPIYLVTDRGSEYVNKEMAHLCTLMGIRHSPRTAYSPWTNGLVEVQNRNLGTHLRMFLHDTPQIYEFLIIGSPHPKHIFTDHKPLLHCFTKKGNLSPRFYRAQMQLTKFSKLKIIHTPGKNLSVADMLSRSFTKAELQLNQLKHKHLPQQIDFALLQDNTLKPVHYLIKHEEILPHQKHDSHPILADYGTDQFSIRINDKGNDIIVKPLHSLIQICNSFSNQI